MATLWASRAMTLDAARRARRARRQRPGPAAPAKRLAGCYLHAGAAGQRSAPELGFDLLQRDRLPRLVQGGVSLGGILGILSRAQRLNHRLRHDRGDPLAALGDVDDLAAGGLARRPGHSRALLDRKLAHPLPPSAHQLAPRISPVAAEPVPCL